VKQVTRKYTARMAAAQGAENGKIAAEFRPTPPPNARPPHRRRTP